MKTVNFLPVIGTGYQSGIVSSYFNCQFPFRLLALGESHHCANPEDAIPTITQNVIRSLYSPDIEFEGWINTYTRFIKALTGDYSIKYRSSDKIQSAWDSIAFYNYVQTPTYGPRVSPTNEQFIESKNAFLEILDELVENSLEAAPCYPL